MAIDYKSADKSIAAAKIVFDAEGLSDEEIMQLTYDLAALAPTRLPGREIVARTQIQRAGARNWTGLKKIEIKP